VCVGGWVYVCVCVCGCVCRRRRGVWVWVVMGNYQSAPSKHGPIAVQFLNLAFFKRLQTFTKLFRPIVALITAFASKLVTDRQIFDVDQNYSHRF